MTNLKKLSENLNLNILNSTEATSLKGGRRKRLVYSANGNSIPPKVPKPVKGGGAGLPPTLDSVMFS